MSDSLHHHGLQHARPPCPLPTPGACSSSCPSSQWCHPTISSSVIPFSSHLHSFQASGSFLMCWLFVSGGQSTGASSSASVLQMNIQGWLPVGLTGLISLLFKELSTVFSSTTVQRPSIFWHSVLQFSQEAGKVVWYSHLLKNIPQFVVIHTVKGGALQQKLIVFKIKINTLIFQKCIFLDFLESPRLGCQPQGGQEATIRNRHGAKDWSKMGKGVRKGCILSPCLFNFYAEYIIQNARLDEAQSWSQDCQEKYQQP